MSIFYINFMHILRKNRYSWSIIKKATISEKRKWPARYQYPFGNGGFFQRKKKYSQTDAKMPSMKWETNVSKKGRIIALEVYQVPLKNIITTGSQLVLHFQ